MIAETGLASLYIIDALNVITPNSKIKIRFCHKSEF